MIDVDALLERIDRLCAPDVDDRIRMHSSDRGEPPMPPRVDTRWHPDGCTCRACKSGQASTRDAFRALGTAPPFDWARGTA